MDPGTRELDGGERDTGAWTPEVQRAIRRIVEDGARALTRVYERFGETRDLDTEEMLSCVCRIAREEGGVDIALVGRLIHNAQGVPVRAKIVAGVGLDDAAGFEYRLSGTPCMMMTEHCVSFVARDVAARYPEDEILRAEGIEAYAASVIPSVHARAQGILIGLSRSALHEGHHIVPVLSSLASRLGAELDHRAQDRRHEQMLDALPDGVIIHQKGRIVYANKAAGVMRGESSGRALVGRASGDLCGAHPCAESGCVGERVITDPSGRTRRVACTVDAITHDGEPAVRVIERDLTEEQRRARLFDRSFEIAPTPTAIVDPDARVRRMNLAMRRLFDVDETPGGRDIGDWLVREHADRVRALVADVQRTGACAWITYVFMAPFAHGRCLKWTACADPDNGDIVLVASDETNWRQSEQRIRRYERAQTTALLAGGVAHDLGNLISAIAGHAHLADGAIADDHPAAETIASIREVIEHAEELMVSLQTLGRGFGIMRTPLDIGEMVEGARTLLERIGSGVAPLRFDIEAGAVVEGDASRLRQVLVNLVSNARNALRGTDGGTIDVRVRAPKGGESWVEIRVADNGPGIDSATLDEIFQPFFTTAPRGSGTGLGLALCHAIIAEHGGEIDVESALGEGATFIVRLPACAHLAPDVASASVRGVPVALAYPEGLERDIVVEMLDRAGCRVVETPESASVVVTTLERASEVEGVARVVITPSRAPLTGGRDGDVALERPFDGGQLARAIARALAPRGESA